MRVKQIPGKHTAGAFWRGFWSHFRGAWMTLCRARLLAWAAVPVAITLALLVGGMIGGGVWVWHWLDGWLSPQDGWWSGPLRWSLLLGIYLAMPVVAYLLFSLVRQVVAAPFNDVLSLRAGTAYRRRKSLAETAGATGSVYGEGAARNILRALTDTLRLCAAEYLAYLIVLPFLFVPVAGFALFWVVRAYYAGVNAMDIALSCRGFTYAEKQQIFRANRARMIGLGFGTALFDMTLVLAIVSLPASVVGATIVYLDLECGKL